MADEPQDDVLELDEEQIVGDEQQEDSVEDTTEDSFDEIPTFDDEPEEQATDLVKHLRQQIRERDKKLAQVQRPAEQPIEVGARPTMEGCEWDQERFDQELDAWDSRREARRKQDEKAKTQAERQSVEWDTIKNNYAQRKAALRVPDKDEAEATALGALTEQQQAVIVKLGSVASLNIDPALLVVALGKNPARLERLAATDDVLVLAAEIGRMGATLQVKRGKRPPEPERIVRGGTVPGSDKAEEKLEAEARRTGDRSALLAYRQKNKK